MFLPPIIRGKLRYFSRLAEACFQRYLNVLEKKKSAKLYKIYTIVFHTSKTQVGKKNLSPYTINKMQGKECWRKIQKRCLNPVFVWMVLSGDIYQRHKKLRSVSYDHLNAESKTRVEASSEITFKRDLDKSLNVKVLRRQEKGKTGIQIAEGSQPSTLSIHSLPRCCLNRQVPPALCGLNNSPSVLPKRRHMHIRANRPKVFCWISTKPISAACICASMKNSRPHLCNPVLV